MATTIITKNGSGAPAAGDLVQGELAVDLTNQTLYSKDSSGNVFKVGDTGGGSPGTFTDLVATDSFTSPGIDDNATSTAITIDASENVGIGTNAPSTSLDIIRNGVQPFRVESTSGNRVSMRLANTGGNAFVEAIDSNIVIPSGNVGVGDTNPDSPLSIFNSGWASINLTSSNANTAVGGRIEFNRDGETLGTNIAGTASGLSLTTGTAERMRIDTAGNVGIGEANPSKLLHVKGSGSTARALIESASTGDGMLQFQNASTTNGFYVGLTGALTGDGILFHEDAKDIILSTSATERMRIDATGNVGIGTSDPDSILHVNKSSASCSSIFSSGSGGVFLSMQGANGTHQIQYGANASSPTFAFYDAAASATRMTLDESGRMALGGHAAYNRLDIQGAPTSSLASTESQLALRNTNPNRATYFTFDQTGDLTVYNTGGGGTGGNTVFHQTSGEAMRIDSTGNVGIGTSDPQQALHVAGGGLQIEGNISAPAAGTESALIDYFNNNMRFWSRGTSSTRGTFEFVQVENDGQNQQSPMVIDASGNVGIGTSQPGLYNSNANDLVAGLAGTGGNRGITIASGSASLGTLAFANGATGNDLARQFIRADHNDGAMLFATGAGEKMRIDASGKLLVGTTAPIGAGASGVTVADISSAIGQVSIGKTYSGTTGAMKFYYGSTEVGRIDYSDTTTTYITSSDERLKENVVDAPAGNIDALQVRSFDWKIDGEHQEYGFIAQELETVAPYAVSKGETDEDMWGVDYSKLVPMLVKEIQDLKAEVAALKGA